jgi:hypothetical protein
LIMTTHCHVSLLNDRWATSLASRRQSCGKESNSRLTNYDIDTFGRALSFYRNISNLDSLMKCFFMRIRITL